MLFLHKLVQPGKIFPAIQNFKMRLRSVLYIILILCVSVTAYASPDMGAYVVEAVAKYDAGDYARAEAILHKVLEEDPQNDAALYYMAMCSLAKKQTDRAEDYLVKAISADPSNYWYRHSLASLYAYTRRPELTIVIYEKLLSDFPEKTGLYFELVELYAATGKKDKALSTLDEVETVFGMTESIAMYRYNLLLQSGRQDEARKSLEEYNSRYSSPFVLTALAEHQLSEHDDSTALAYYEEALDMAPDFSPALLGKAEILRMNRKYEGYFKVLEAYVSNQQEAPQAKTDYLRQVVVRMDPRFVVTYDARLMDVLQQVCRTHPDSAEAAVLYGEYLMYTGRWTQLSGYGRSSYEKFSDELSFLEMASLADQNLNEYEKVLDICDVIIEFFLNILFNF